MNRDDLRRCFGEPLRIESSDGGAEDWYYRFASWKSRPAGSTEVTEDFGEKTSWVSLGLQISKDATVLPIHISPQGYVVEPLPPGRIVKD